MNVLDLNKSCLCVQHSKWSFLINAHILYVFLAFSSRVYEPQFGYFVGYQVFTAIIMGVILV